MLARKFEDVNFQGDSRILNHMVENGVDTNAQDQTTRPIVGPLCRRTPSSLVYTLALDTAPNTYTIEVTDATGIVAGNTIGLFQDSINPASYIGKVLSISTNTLTMDSPIDVIFAVALSPVLFRLDCDFGVDGSSIPAIFAITNNSEIPIDITRVIFTMITTGVAQFNTFGDIAALTRGCVLRKKKADGTYNNIFNVKKNADFQNIMYDIDFFLKANPQNVSGLSGRFTFTRLGIVVRLEQNEALEFVIQDNLTAATIESFTMIGEGHFTDETN